MKDIILEGIIFDHFPSDDDDFKEGVLSEHTMDQLRESCVKEINKLIDQRVKKARIEELNDVEIAMDQCWIYNHLHKRIAELKKDDSA